MRTILFDIDGTLLMTNSGGATALRQAMSDEFGLRDPRTEIQFGGRTDRSILTELLTINDLADTQANRDRLRDRYVELFPETLRKVGGKLMPGVLPLLDAVNRDGGLRSYIMTGNFHATGQCKLDHFGLSNFFRGIFGGDHDSDRDHLARRTSDSIALRYGRQSISELWVIGDTVADIRCGHAINAKVIAVCTGGQTRAQLEAESPLAIRDDLTNFDEVLTLLTT